MEAAFNYISAKDGGLPFDTATETSFKDAALRTPYSISNRSPSGPLNDGRVKPDVYAPGTFVLSGNPSTFSSPSCVNSYSTDFYGSSSDVYYDSFSHGPSVSTGIVSALAALVREYLQTGYHANGYNEPSKAYKNPSAALVKALLIHGAVKPSYSVRRFSFNNFPSCPTSNEYITDVGFGYVRLNESLRTDTSNLRLFFPGHNESQTGNSVDQYGDPYITSNSINTYTYCAFYSSNQLAPKITLVWTDPAATAGASAALVNDLDLIVVYGASTFYGNGKSTADTVNNVEKLTLAKVTSTEQKKQINIQVSSKTLSGSQQSYAIVVSGWVSAGSCDTALKPDGSVQDTSTTGGASSCSTLLCQITGDSYSLAAYIIIFVSAIVICCFFSVLTCCCCCAYIWAPKKKKVAEAEEAGPPRPTAVIEVGVQPCPDDPSPPLQENLPRED